jgi:flagellar protein FliO/FliZ
MNIHPTLLLTSLLGVAEAVAAPAEQAGRLAESPLSTANLATTALGLLVVLGVMLGLAWLVRRFVQMPSMSRGAVRVLGGVSLGARERAVLVAVDRRRLLVGVAPGQVRTLLDLGESEGLDDADAGEPSNAPFARQLGQVLRRPKTGDGEVQP